MGILIQAVNVKCIFQWQLMTYSNIYLYAYMCDDFFLPPPFSVCIYINFRVNLLFKVPLELRFTHVSYMRDRYMYAYTHIYIFFWLGVCRYNISSNQVNSYLNIMRFNWCIMVFILLLVKANKILVRLTSIRSFVRLFVRSIVSSFASCVCVCLFLEREHALRIVKREPHLVKKNYGNFVKWNKNKCKKAHSHRKGTWYKGKKRKCVYVCIQAMEQGKRQWGQKKSETK